MATYQTTISSFINKYLQSSEGLSSFIYFDNRLSSLFIKNRVILLNKKYLIIFLFCKKSVEKIINYLKRNANRSFTSYHYFYYI